MIMSFERTLARNPDLLPGGTTMSEAQAVDRFVRGERLGPRAARRLRSFQERMNEEKQAQRSTDWNERDRILREEYEQRDGRAGGRPSSAMSVGGRAPAAAPPRPGVASPWTAPRSTPGEAGTRAGGGSALTRRSSGFDATKVSADDFHRRLAGLGLDASWHTVDQCSELAREHARSPSVALTVAERRCSAEVSERQRQRAREVEAGRIDGRTATPEQVKARLQQILGQHRDTPLIDESFRPADGKPLPPPDYGSDHTTIAEAAKRRAARAAAVVAKGGRADARGMDHATVAEYAARRGFNWPAGSHGGY